MNTETRAKKINEKIRAITADRSKVVSNYDMGGDSVQAELRLFANWGIRYTVDNIKYPKDLSHDNDDLWIEMRQITSDIYQAASLGYGCNAITDRINAKTKTGPVRRAEAEANFWVESGKMFLADHRQATGKRNLANIRKTITELQAKQKALLPELRKSNSEYLAGKKAEKTEQARKNSDALESGRFWDADKETLKGYFHPPFSKNYLADVSEKWRAALFLECESASFKTAYGNWGHKLTGTNHGYLCGIDDNGDEWGHHVTIYQGIDDFGDLRLEGDIEWAMTELFDIPAVKLADCVRQGDLLFCMASSIPDDTDLDPHKGAWEIRESHAVESTGLERNGQYFQSKSDIHITHTSHPEVVLPPGEYRLYELQQIEGVEYD